MKWRHSGSRRATLSGALLALLVAVASAYAHQEENPKPSSPQPAEPVRAIVVNPGAPKVWHGELISLSLKDADLQEVLRSFARLADVNLILDPRVKGKVTLELHDVPWDQALYVILKTHGLGAEIDGRIWSVRPGLIVKRR